MKTHTQSSVWKQQVSLPIAVMAIAMAFVSTLALFESQTGLAASIRNNSVYGALPSHSAAPSPMLRRFSQTSSVSSHTANALERRERRLGRKPEISTEFPWGLSESGSLRLRQRHDPAAADALRI